MRKVFAKGILVVMMTIGATGMTSTNVLAHHQTFHKISCSSKQKTCTYKDKNHNKKCDRCGKMKTAHHSNKKHH